MNTEQENKDLKDQTATTENDPAAETKQTASDASDGRAAGEDTSGGEKAAEGGEAGEGEGTGADLSGVKIDDEILNNDALFEDADTEDFFSKAGNDVLFDDDEADSLPAFDFAKPQTIKLKDGSEFEFGIPDLQSETRADNLRKTTIITSPAKVNGFNPTQETTDYATADMRYFIDNCKRFRGLRFNRGDDPTAWTDATRVVRTEKNARGNTRTITAAHIFPIKHARAAVGRLYGGKIEVEKPKGGEVEIKVVNEARFVVVRQEIGVEQTDDGGYTRPTNVLRYVFREPVAGDLTFWQTKCFNGKKIPIKGGGSMEDRFFNTDQVAKLFDMLIERVEGASLDGVPLDVKNSDQLRRIPVGVKRTAVAICMGEVSGDVGNS